MTLIEAASISLFAYLGWIATPWLGGQGIAYHVFGKPLVAGLIVGIIMGDVTNGVIIGATINALYVGIVTPGGAMSSDINFAGYVGTALALSTGVNAVMAVSIAVPLGLIGTFVWQLFATINAFLVHKTDNYAANGDTGKLTFLFGVPNHTHYFPKKIETGVDGIGQILFEYDRFNIMAHSTPKCNSIKSSHHFVWCKPV